MQYYILSKTTLSPLYNNDSKNPMDFSLSHYGHSTYEKRKVTFCYIIITIIISYGKVYSVCFPVFGMLPKTQIHYLLSGFWDSLYDFLPNFVPYIFKFP